MKDDEGWIDYWKPRDQEKPKEGFVEIINTFDDSRRTFMDMSDVKHPDMILWNKAAPMCVSKYRFVPESRFIEVKLMSYQNAKNKLEQDIRAYDEVIKDCQKRLTELTQ